MTVRSHPDLASSAAPRRRPQVSDVQIDGRAVLYLSEDGSMHELDELGTLLWNCFDGEVPLAELADDLADVYPDAEPQEIERDLLAFVRRLMDDGLVEIRSGSRRT